MHGGWRDRLLLSEVLDAAARLVELTTGRTKTDFDANPSRRSLALFS